MKTLRAVGAVAIVAVAVFVVAWLVRRPVPAGAAKNSWAPISEQRLSHGRFDNFTVYSPHGTPRGFVLLLSDTAGWTPALSELATHLAAEGAMVAGLDVAQLNANFEKDAADCVYPDGDLENLSHFVQAYFRLPTYLSPILAGYAAGGTLAYATLMQAPKNTFTGAVSLDFCPTFELNKPLCKGSGIEFTALPQGKGVEFLPAKIEGNSWTVLQRAGNARCDVATVRSFVAQVPGAQVVPLAPAGDGALEKGRVPTGNDRTAAKAPDAGGNGPTVGDAAASAGVNGATLGAGLEAASPPWSPQMAAAFDTLLARNSGTSTDTVPAALGDLPIVTVPALAGTTPSDVFAIILSGDGGWAGLDKDVAGALAASGIPVIGLDSLRYFWAARTPQGLATDIDRMIRYYVPQLGKQRVLLIGYSQGADVLPFAVNRLNPATRDHVALTAVIGMSEHALFEFHVTSWISDDDSGPATMPEVERITGMPVLCIYGDGETDTLCPQLDPQKATIVKLKGGHHFDGDYAGLARTILTSARHL